ncbi:uncharacterized protein LOC129241482 [Anastrepha obliqua]|uniref:uncharacterized protein LOC129241482 n=1 Tax=Anastrepha obliqua TaxID=95512 RepID=UPI00240981D0|nr:uncharacterized protein LOC129241482 [Anastrepha obliqua]
MLKLAIAVLIFAAGLHLAMPQLPPSAALPSHQGLARLLFTSRITALNPQVSVACFTDYIAHSSAIAKAYSRDYKSCLLEASEEHKRIDGESVVERREIVEASETVCRSLRSCNEHNSTLELFNCHTKIGTNNTKSTYSISGNASQYATVLQERYRLIDLHHQQCGHDAERKYVTDTANNYNYLQSCLDGRVKPRPLPTTAVPAISSTTTTPTTPSTTTTTTTEAPALLQSSTTIAPPVVIDELMTTEQNQGIQAQVAQLLNLLN